MRVFNSETNRYARYEALVELLRREGFAGGMITLEKVTVHRYSPKK